MKPRSLDLRLLTVFDAVLRKRSLTAAAESLGITQPAISQSLARLRTEFADPLFVRTAKGMAPTARAAELASAVRQVLDVVRDRIDPSPDFDPRAAERVFRLSMSDLGMVVFMPRLNERLRRLAPRVRIEVHPLEVHALREGLEEGRLDLAIGALPALGPGTRQQRLYADQYVCLVRGEHPTIKGRLSQKQFRAAEHLLVGAEGTGHSHQAVEKLLAERVPPSQVALRLPSFVAAPVVLAATDYVLTVPSGAAREIGARFGLRTLKTPFAIPPVEIRQYWHERYHRDPANKWLRGLIHDLFAER